MNNLKSRLEIIAKRQRMGFHFTETTCYLTADLFYLEVLLLPSGEVQDVKVALHGEHPISSDSLLHLLRSNNFDDFSMWLGELFAQYNIPGDNRLNIASFFKNIYFIVFEELSEFKPAVQAAQVAIGMSKLTHKLQMTSIISQPPQMDAQGCSAVVPLGGVPNEILPACFLLRLMTPIPVFSDFVERVGQITDVTIPDCGLQWAPLPKLLLLQASASANGQSEPLEEQEIFTVLLPDSGMHTYILPGSSWDVPTHRAALMGAVPFTHPAHVSALLELLRHQCVLNTLLKSCLTPQSASPVLVKIPNPRQITCQLFAAGFSDPTLDEYISTVMTRLEEIATTPLSTSHPITTVAENDRL
ncbi:mediator of RNA polymerase II transcription subunit 1-like [Anableps anableps]